MSAAELDLVRGLPEGSISSSGYLERKADLVRIYPAGICGGITMLQLTPRVFSLELDLESGVESFRYSGFALTFDFILALFSFYCGIVLTAVFLIYIYESYAGFVFQQNKMLIREILERASDLSGDVVKKTEFH